MGTLDPRTTERSDGRITRATFERAARVVTYAVCCAFPVFVAVQAIRAGAHAGLGAIAALWLCGCAVGSMWMHARYVRPLLEDLRAAAAYFEEIEAMATRLRLSMEAESARQREQVQ